MRLALSIHTFNNTKGGKEIFTWNLVRKLLAKDVTIDIVANQYDTIDDPNLSFHRVPMFGKALGLHRWTFSWASKRKVDQLETDLVYTNGKAGYGDIIRIGGLPLKSHLRVLAEQRPSRLARKVFEIRKKMSLSKRMALRLERQSFCETDFKRVIVASSYIKRELLRSYSDVPEERVQVISNGYNPDRYNLEERQRHRAQTREELSIPDGAPVLIFVGNNFELKGLDDALDYLRMHEDFHLIVVGRGDPRSRGEAVDDRVRWVGEVDRVTPYYAAADSLVLPTKSDGFGLVVLEALAMGLFVLVSNRAGASELIKDPWMGRVFDNLIEDVGTDFSQYLNGSYVEKRGEFARDYTWDKVTGRYLSVFEDCV